MLATLLWTAVVPALVAGALAGVGVSLGGVRGRITCVAAMGAGYLVGHLAAAGRPSLPPATSTQSLFWLVLVAVVLGVSSVAIRAHRRGLRLTLRAALVALFLALLTRPMVLYQWSAGETALWLPGLAVFFFLLWAAFDGLELSARPASLSLAWMLSALGAAVAVALSHSALLGQLGGVIAAVVAGGAVAGGAVAVRGRRGYGAGSTATVAVAYSGVLLSAVLYSDLEAFRALALGVAPLGAAVGGLRSLKSKRTELLAVAATVLLVVLPVVGPLVVEALSEDGGYEEMGYYE